MAFGAWFRRSSSRPASDATSVSGFAGLFPICLGAGAQVLVLLAMLGSWNVAVLPWHALQSALLAAWVFSLLPFGHWARLVRDADVDGGIAPAAAEALAPVAPLLGAIVVACYWLGHCALAGLALGFAVDALPALAQAQAGLPLPPASLLLPGLLLLPCLPYAERLQSLVAWLAAGTALAAAAFLWHQGAGLLPVPLAVDAWPADDAFSCLGAWCAAAFLAAPSLAAGEAALALADHHGRRSGRARLLLTAAILGVGLVVIAALARGHATGTLAVAGNPTARAALALAAGTLALTLSGRAALAALRALFSRSAAGIGSGVGGVGGPWLPAALTAFGILGFLLLREAGWLFAGAGLAYLIALTGVAVVPLMPRRWPTAVAAAPHLPAGSLAALLGVVAWTVVSLFGLQAWGVQAVLVGLVMVYGGGLFHLGRGLRGRRTHASVHAKLLAGMLLVLALNGAGYLLAHQALQGQDRILTALLDDLFVMVALLTVLVGVVLPAMIVHSLTRAAEAAEQLTQGAVASLRDGIDALGRGELDGTSVAVNSERLHSPFPDEIGRIASSINSLQDDVQRAARGLDSAREKLRLSRAELFHQARRDSLTGLHNRRAFEETLERLVEDRRQADPGHALLYLDLDQFKIVNDTCGHDAGDELLRQVSLLLAAQLRGDDILARLGGDEFGVILANCTRDNAIRIAEAMVVAVRELSFGWQDRVFRIGVSIGVVHFLGGSTSLTELLSAADKSCYCAKEQGRNRLHAYAPDDDEISTRSGEMQWVSRIHEAMEQGRMCLYAQAIVPLGAPTATTHHELLLRMVDAAGELVPPMAFIPAAERFGVMTLLDRWVVRSALDRLGEILAAEAAAGPAGGPGAGAAIGSLAINLSGASITDETFLGFVKEQFLLSRVPHQRVWFEITETSAIANLRSAKRFISELRALGCRFGLDDFGAGMSSFGYLRQLEVDFLKIDGAFVQDMVDDPIDHAMVSAINRIGQLMGLRTIAEFVEDPRAIAMLRELGVDMIQGNGVSAPVPFVRPPCLPALRGAAQGAVAGARATSERVTG